MMFTLRAMKTYQSAQTLGFFDVELRVQWLEAKGNPLSRLDAVIDWEGFRPLLAQALAKPAKGPGGRPTNDPIKMFKLLVVQRYYNLTDEQTEYQVSDRLTFQKFVGWTVADKVPDANTLWDFREALVRVGVFEQLFEQFAQQLQAQGLLAQEGKLVDASFVDVPRQRNSCAENATIKAGAVPEAWAETAGEATAKGRGRPLDQEERRSTLRLQEPCESGREKQVDRTLRGHLRQRVRLAEAGGVGGDHGRHGVCRQHLS
jgi:transposase